VVRLCRLRTRYREDNSEYEHYTDSGGKSGGQKEKLAYTVLAASLVYQFGLEWGEVRSRSLRFVMIDEAFGRGSDESARFGLELFRRLNLQLLIVTPLQKIHIIEPYVSHVGFVYNPQGRESLLRNLTSRELQVLRGLAKGMSNKLIARKFEIAEGMVGREVLDETEVPQAAEGTGVSEDEVQADIEGDLRTEGEHAVAVLAERAAEAGVDAETAVLEGVPDKDIVEYVTDHDVDVVVMGTHGRTGRDKLARLGSVTERVVKNAPVPVLVVNLDTV
jgi:nucleotide-binding universal stress UspA family protein